MKKDEQSNCMKNYIKYSIPCITCQKRGIVRVYEGESYRNAKLRGEEHLRGLTNRKEGNPLFKHKQNHHPDETAEFKMEV